MAKVRVVKRALPKTRWRHSVALQEAVDIGREAVRSHGIPISHVALSEQGVPAVSIFKHEDDIALAHRNGRANERAMKDVDPVRRLIRERAKELGLSDAQLSRAINHSDSYINQYMNRGSPVVLPDRERKLMAKVLRLEEALLEPGATDTPAVTYARQKLALRSGRFIPAFQEGKPIDFDNVIEQIARPDFVALSDLSFGLWIHNEHGKVGPGDLAFVSGGKPARVGDLVVVLTLDQRHIVAIGTLGETSGDKATVTGHPKPLSKNAHVILRIAAARYS